jgi:hypothetical protein
MPIGNPEPNEIVNKFPRGDYEILYHGGLFKCPWLHWELLQKIPDLGM